MNEQPAETVGEVLTEREVAQMLAETETNLDYWKEQLAEFEGRADRIDTTMLREMAERQIRKQGEWLRLFATIAALQAELSALRGRVVSQCGPNPVYNVHNPTDLCPCCRRSAPAREKIDHKPHCVWNECAAHRGGEGS